MRRWCVGCGVVVVGTMMALAGAPSAGVRAQAGPIVQQPAPAPTPAPAFAVSYEQVQAYAEAARLGLDYLPGEVAIKFRSDVGTSGQLRALFGLRSRPTLSGLRWVGQVAVLRDYAELDPAILVRQLRLQPEVEWAEPVYLRKPSAAPNDPSYAAQQWHFRSIGMDNAWTIQPDPGHGVTVAIIDTGVTTVDETYLFPTWNGQAVQMVPMPFAVSPELRTPRLLPGYDFAFFASGSPVLDLDGHGTHVASTVGQETNNGQYGAGLAYGARLMPLKACIGYWELQIVRSSLDIPGYQPLDSGGCPTTAIADAIRYAADNGAKVINLSLGGGIASAFERDAIEYAVARGVVVVTAAGNSYEEGNPVDYPAGFAPDIRGLISVGAVGRTLRRAYYSATGPQVEVVAPGGDMRQGGEEAGIWQTTLRFGDVNPASVIFPRFDRYIDDAYQGTSMASPQVAGLAAMLMAQGITRPEDIETIITRTARDLGASGRDDEYGFGLIQPRTALFGLGIRR